MAQTCPSHASGGGPASENLHVNAAHLFVELVDRDGRPVAPGEEGRIVVTDLGNRVAPLVRYDVGDTGVMAGEPCPCRRGLPLLTRLCGRAMTLVVLPSGRRLPVLCLRPAFWSQSDLLLEHQLAQVSPDSIVVSVVPASPAYGEAEAAALERELAKCPADTMAVKVG
ncbi:MAG: hypothetical protein C4551_03105 [Bacillota bacterium]|nr:MAG: hypothetical protein C4551_03105 [Bacillota bacterium]